MPGTRPPRIVLLRGLSGQLEQSLRVIERGLRSAKRDLKGALRNGRSSANAVSKRRLAAYGSEGAIETSTSMRPGWLAWAAFILPGRAIRHGFHG